MERIQAVITQQAGQITCNFENVEKALTERLKEYEGAVFTEDSKTIAKKELASLRAEQKGFKDNLKEAKKTFMAPWESFEAQAKELIAMYDKPIGLIDSQIKEFEEKRVEEKRILIEKIYQETAADVAEYLPLERIYNPKWENAGTREKVIREEMIQLSANVRQAVETIRGMRSDAEEEALRIYKKTLSLPEAIAHVNSYERQKAQILQNESEKRRREEVEQARLEERRRVEEEGRIYQEAVQETLEAVTMVDEEAAAPLKLPESRKYLYTVVATPEEIKEIEMALESIGVYYERKEL